MALCKRNSRDPLLRAFLGKFKVNLLEAPVAQVSLGSLYVVRGEDVVNVPFSTLYTGTISTTPIAGSDAVIDEITETLSSELRFDGLVSLVATILAALNIFPGAPKIKVALTARGIHGAKIRLQNLKRRQLDRAGLALELRKCRLRKRSPYAGTKHKVYICVGTWAASSITVMASDGRKVAASAQAAFAELLSGTAKASVNSTGKVETTIKSRNSPIFGVEVIPVTEHNGQLSLETYRPEMRMRGPHVEDPEDLVLVEGPDSAFLRVQQA